MTIGGTIDGVLGVILVFFLHLGTCDTWGDDWLFCFWGLSFFEGWVAVHVRLIDSCIKMM